MNHSPMDPLIEGYLGYPDNVGPKTPRICRSKLTICSGVSFFPFAIFRSFLLSHSHQNWNIKGRALQEPRRLFELRRKPNPVAGRKR